jgi:uncharacterized membrane protein
MNRFTLRNSAGVTVSFASEVDMNNMLSTLGDEHTWNRVRPSLGSMTLNEHVIDALERLGYGKGTRDKIGAIKFIRSMTGAGLIDTKNFCETYLWS